MAFAIAAYLLALNVLAFVAFGMDKLYAIKGRRRVPEKTLLSLAFLGGWGGAKFGQKRFRHKTQKQPFKRILDAIPLMHLGAGLIALSWLIS